MASTPADRKKSRATTSFPMTMDTWDQKLKEHHTRVNKAKASLPNETPFQLSFRSPRQSPRGPRALPTLSPRRGSTSGNGAVPHLSGGGARDRAPLTIDDLPEEERRLCEDFIRMLQRKSSDDGRDLLEAVYAQSETKRLLKGYGGVYPSAVSTGKRHSGGDDDE